MGALDNKEDLVSIFDEWFKICCVKNAEWRTLSADIYSNFCSWCEARYLIKSVFNKNQLSKKLMGEGFSLCRGTGGVRMISGFLILTKEEIMKNNETVFPGYEMQDNYGVISPEDSRLWLELFILASKKNCELCEVLQYVRNTGAKLVRNPKYGYIIQPVIGVYGWSSKEEYMRERKPLEKHRELLLKLLADLAKGASGR